MKGPLRIAIVSSEVAPFAKTGGLADVAGSLPSALRDRGCQVKILLPLYKQVRDGQFNLRKIKRALSLPFFKKLAAFDLYGCKHDGVPVYFIENDEYFDREYIYGTPKGDYPDNALRFSFFSKAALAALKALGFKADVIHCNDWQTGLIPFYLKFLLKDNPFFVGVKTLFTIHNLGYRGLFEKSVMEEIEIPEKFFTSQHLEFYGKLSLIKSGILYSDALNTVSKCYSRQILTPEFGCGLEGVLRKRQGDLHGILNGADYKEWDPARDLYLTANYSLDTIHKKVECKKDLLRETKLVIQQDRPIIGVVSRLAEQKGIDILAQAIPELLKLKIGLVLLGKGEEKYEAILKSIGDKCIGRVSVTIAYDNRLAHKIEGGADLFLITSRYEPCGLNQMYSLKYGTIPVVRATGGLDDTIIDFDEDKERGNGFKFMEPTPQALLEAVKRATRVFQDKKTWSSLVRRAMQFDFSWDKSAEEYIQLYRKLCSAG